MNITAIQQCADFFQKYYLKTFYLVITYVGKSFILIGEKANFPHLMGNEAPRGRALKHLTRLRHIRALTLQILAFRLAPLGRESGVSEL